MVRCLTKEGQAMSYPEWKEKKAGFKKVDVRGIQGNFFFSKIIVFHK